MPQIIVMADISADGEQPPIMFRERVNVSDFESEHAAAQLLERLGWAVGDADEVNRRGVLEPPAPWAGRHDPEEWPREPAFTGRDLRPVG